MFAKKLQHCASIEIPLNPIKKLASDTFITSLDEVILDNLLHPIVISKIPLIKAVQVSLVILNNEKGM